ncbi:hypothetical protein HDU97_003496 [Phlyctochytrium planicorne]|nr:hypothetical protein HDU97_003496 [Phlyctochytrium planicorne]
MENISKTFGILDALKNENAVFKQNFDELKQSYDNLLRKFEQLESSYDALNMEKESKNKLLNDVEEFWKEKYEKQKEVILDLKKKKMEPQEVEKLRLRLVCEINQVHGKRISQLEEILQEKENVFRKAAESETLKQQKEALLEEELARYKKKLKEVELSNDTIEDVEQLRSAQRKAIDLGQKIKVLEEEILELRLLQLSNARIKDMAQSNSKIEKDCLEKIVQVREDGSHQYKDLMDQKHESESGFHELSKSYTVLESSFDRHKKESQWEIEKLRKELQDAAAMGEAVISQNRRLLTEQEKLATQLEQEKTKVAKYESLASKQSQDVEELRLRELGLKEEIRNIEVQFKLSTFELQRCVDELKNENQDLRVLDAERQELLRTEREEWKSSLANLSAKYEKLNEECRKLRESRAAHLRQIEELEKNLETSNLEISNLTLQLEMVKAHDQKLRTSIDSKKSDLLAFLASEIRK